MTFQLEASCECSSTLLVKKFSVMHLNTTLKSSKFQFEVKKLKKA